MANHDDARQFEERDEPIRPLNVRMAPSTIEPLPYFPNLHRHIHGVTASLALTYLEIHHPAPRDSNGTILTTPVTLNLDAVAADLQVSRRTLCVNLSALCTWYPTDLARWSAARAGREFLNSDHTRYGRWKFYSATGSKTWRPGTIIQLRRNFGHISMLLQDAGIDTLAVPVPAIAFPIPKLAENAASASASYASCKTESLIDVLLRGSQLSMDRRTLRYPRLSSAVDAGLEPASVLSAKQPKRKRRKVHNHAVDPELPEALTRIIKDQNSG